MGTLTPGTPLAPDLQSRLEATARRLGQQPSWIVEEALRAYLATVDAPPASPARPPVFLDFAASLLPHAGTPTRAALDAAWRQPETTLLPALLDEARLPPAQADAANTLARRLADGLRTRRDGVLGDGRAGLVRALLQEYALSSQEGVALMCLAEALLRIPDDATRDALIRDKIGHGHWREHLGHSPSPFVNAATWGLLLTGRLVATHHEGGLSAALGRVLARGGEPLIRLGVDWAMRLLGEQFVAGQTIAEALARATPREAAGFRHSYDMLGEAALTEADALRYLAAYESAIHAIGQAAAGRGPVEGPGISIKLSALHPRYSRAQHARVMTELLPRLRDLARLARRYGIGLNIDAEEADRLDLSVDLLEALCRDPALTGWDGLGFVAQAYQKRCPHLIDHLAWLARASHRRLMLRLVKGAYWDSEIKLAQSLGLADYPVYTRKPHTDVAYLACARRLLAAPDAFYPQFATHNAHTLAAIHQLAGGDHAPIEGHEFQCLHGMGEALYAPVVSPLDEGGLGRPCRIYAPVGEHRSLLAYLVRRLLENGANTSFVHQLADPALPMDELVANPVARVERQARSDGRTGLPHPRIPLPRDLHGGERANAAGVDLVSEPGLAALATALLASEAEDWRAEPWPAGQASTPWQPITNPADPRDVVGWVRDASPEDVDRALDRATLLAPLWAAEPPARRAARLEAAADLLEADLPRCVGLLVREAGKTCANAVAEVREAVDFLRYYAAQARRLDPATAPLGPVVCISPWNFPLAIFIGQVAAALAAGNPVLAKPAGQTPLIAAHALRLLQRAGLPEGVLQLLPGPGDTVGARLVAAEGVRGVLFTGSTDVARTLQASLAGRLDAHGRPLPLIAETGGINAMIVDASALPEQVVADVIGSAFDSAGQRCSALRLLCVQHEVAEPLLELLRGALAECQVGNPARLETDIGPLIDARARAHVEHHLQAQRDAGRTVCQIARADTDTLARGHYVLPALVELEHPAELQQEVFGPVLHVLRYARDELDSLVDHINASGYGLTLGLHTRIDETIARVSARARVGNLYVNRNMIGAVVGVQPFGGEGLSGTGPKAGGPLYLPRLLSAPAPGLPRQLMPGHPIGADAQPGRASLLAPLAALIEWAETAGDASLAQIARRYAELSLAGEQRLLGGPTGERNVYSLHPRRRVLCLADTPADRLLQLAAVLAAGSRALWVMTGTDDAAFALHAALPAAVRERVERVTGDELGLPPAAGPAFDVVLHHGDTTRLRARCRKLAQWPGPLRTVYGFTTGDADIPLSGLLLERVVSTNTAAAGGNASLMGLD